MKTVPKKRILKRYGFTLLFFLIVNTFTNTLVAQVQLLESSVVTNDAFYFWKANDPRPFHYGASINPHGNCVKESNGYVFYTWYRGGWADRALMVSRKKIGEGTWVHVELPATLSLVGGKGDTHLTTNIGISPIDGTVHLMFDHHNEDLNYIKSNKNIAYGPDSSFSAANFLPQQNYLIPGQKVTGVTYPDLFNNDQGEMYFERRLGSAVGGNIIMTYYNGNTWSPEKTIIQGTGPQVSQGERNFCYGSAYFMNGKFYYAYSPRWAESPTRLNEGVYLMELGEHMDSKATTVDGKSYDLPIIDHAPFFIADPRSVPTSAGWAGGPQVAISPKNDIYTYISPKNTSPYNYLKKADETAFSEDRNRGALGAFYGNRMYKFSTSGQDLIVRSCLAGTYEWREDFRMDVGISFKKSVQIMNDGKIVAVFSENKNSDKVGIHCFVLQIQKENYTPQTISFESITQKTEGDANFILRATATSGLPVSYTSSNTNIARIVDGNKVEIIGVGTCNIIASQSGNGMFDNAPNVSRDLVVNANTSKANQTISFTLASTNHVWGTPDQILNATASSGLAVQYESTNTDVAEVVGGVLEVKRTGTTIINALQLGDASYNAAPIVGYNLVVPIRQQEINFQNIPEVISGDSGFTLQATSNNPDAKLRFVCPNNQVAIVWSDQVRHILGAGSATITITEEGNEYFTPTQASRTIVVKAKTHVIPGEIEAEHYTTKSGVNVTRWSNSIFYLNAWGANDFAEYTIDVPANGVYEVEVFAASPGAPKKLKVMKGSTPLQSITLRTTPSLTRFLGTKTNINLQQGIQKIKIVGEVGGFNFDRMKITSSAGEVIDEEPKNIFKLQNVATEKYLTSNGTEVSASDSGVGQAKEWAFVKVNFEGTEYYNIDSETTRGILRGSGGGNVIPYAIINTSVNAPAAQSDKIWTVHYDDSDDTYRFEAKDSGRFLYHHEDGSFYNITAADTDDRSKWIATSETGSSLSADKAVFNSSSIKVYPNPSNNNFTIALNNLNSANVKIYNILGKMVYEKSTSKNRIEINNNGNFTSGVYLIKVLADNQKVYYTKLIIKQ